MPTRYSRTLISLGTPTITGPTSAALDGEARGARPQGSTPGQAPRAPTRGVTAEIGWAAREDRAAIAAEVQERGGRGARVPKPTSDAEIGCEGKRGPSGATDFCCRSGAAHGRVPDAHAARRRS